MLAKKLRSKGAVLIEVPKWCGKTTTADQFSGCSVFLARPDVKQQFSSLLAMDMDLALSKNPPMLIDEWQTVPELWDAVRYTVDKRSKMGQFILTGSAVPNHDAEQKIQHSGAGRFAWLTMRPMSLYESGDSNGSVSLETLFTSPDKVFGENKLKLENIAFLVCRGGWPMAIDLPEDAALEQAIDYYEAVTKEDITRADGVKRTAENVQRLMRSYSRHQGAQASIATLKKDLSGNDTTSMDENTINSYLLDRNQAWRPGTY